MADYNYNQRNGEPNETDSSYQWNRKDLSIIPLTKKSISTEYSYIPEPLMRPNFRLGVVGSCGSGKTNVIGNIITRFLTKPDSQSIFSEIFVFAPSILQDPTFEFLKAKNIKDRIYASDSLDTELITEILNGEDRSPKLVYIDDFSTSAAMQTDILHDLFFRSRHSNTSVIFSCQYYYKINISLRQNLSHLILFKSQTKRDEMLVSQELASSDFPSPLFMKAWDMATREKYSFLYIDRLSQGVPKYYIKFETEIVPQNSKESYEYQQQDEEDVTDDEDKQ